MTRLTRCRASARLVCTLRKARAAASRLDALARRVGQRRSMAVNVPSESRTNRRTSVMAAGEIGP
jgi:hypothetical protein